MPHAFTSTLSMPAMPLLALDTSTIALLSTLLLIFLATIISTVATKWSRDKCLKFFHRYHVSFEAIRGAVDWGRFKCFSSGIEIMYDNAYVDTHGRKKTSYMVYQSEIEQQMLSLLRYHDELEPADQRRRLRQIQRTFNPGPMHRFWRQVRNVVNTLKDAFGAAISTTVSQYQSSLAPAGTALSPTATGSVTSIGQTLISKFGNAYEPLLEQYIGQPVILEVSDPLNPNNTSQQYVGYLADYTQQFIAIFNAEHPTAALVTLTLPDVESGPKLPPLPPPPPAGGAMPELPAPVTTDQGVAVRLDGPRFRIQNLRHEPIVLRRLEREGFEPLSIGAVVPPNASAMLPARDARGGKLVVEAIGRIDVLAPRKYASIHHASELVERRGLLNELAIDQLPLVPKILRKGASDDAAQSASGR